MANGILTGALLQHNFILLFKTKLKKHDVKLLFHVLRV
jgi:hypothetical protein